MPWEAPVIRAVPFEGGFVMTLLLGGLTSDYFERDIHVAACSVRIRADLLMRFTDECSELGLRDALVLHAHLHREAETAAFARTDRNGAGDLGLCAVVLLMLSHEVQRS